FAITPLDHRPPREVPASEDFVRMSPSPGAKPIHPRPRSNATLVVPTRNRPGQLLDSIGSVLAQSVLPGTICIVDSSPEAPSRGRIEQLCAAVSVPLTYVHSAPRGSTVQRNVGIDATSGDPVVLIDDDVVLAPEC